LHRAHRQRGEALSHEVAAGPTTIGLAVPAMVVGSPAMAQGMPQVCATLAFDERGHRIFAQH
jgi:hypothetical protein